MINDFFPKYGSLFWGATNKFLAERPEDSGAIELLNKNELVVIAEGVMLDDGFMPSAPIMGVSTNALSVWKNPSVYYKSQAEFKIVCDANDYSLRWDDGEIAECWPGTQMFDVSHPNVPKAFFDSFELHVLNTKTFENFKHVFLDELHQYVIGIAKARPGHTLQMFKGQATRTLVASSAEANSAWTNGTTKLLKQFATRRPDIKVIGNGTYSPAHPALGGHFWQACNNSNQIAVFNNAWSIDVNNYDTLSKNIIIHSVGSIPAMGWPTFEKLCFYNACFASLLDASAQVEDNSFKYPFNHQAITAGAFGRPVEYVNQTSDVPSILEPLPGLKIREFEHASVRVNLNDSNVTYEGKLYNPRSARVIWK